METGSSDARDDAAAIPERISDAAKNIANLLRGPNADPQRLEMDTKSEIFRS